MTTVSMMTAVSVLMPMAMAAAMPAAETAAVVAEPDPAAPAPPWVLGRGRATLPCYSRYCTFQDGLATAAFAAALPAGR